MKTKYYYLLGLIQGSARMAHNSPSEKPLVDLQDYIWSDENTEALLFDQEFSITLYRWLNEAIHAIHGGDYLYCGRLLERLDSNIYDYVA